MRMAAPDRVEAGFADDLRAISGGRMDEAYIRRLAAEAPATIAWLMRHGIAFDRPVYYLSAGPPRIQPVGGGAAILRELERAALEAGVGIRYGCTARAAAGRGRWRRRGDGAAHSRRRGGRRSPPPRSCSRRGGFAGNGEMLRAASGPRRGEPEADLARHLLQYGRRHPHGAGGRSARRRRLERHARRAGRSAQHGTRRPWCSSTPTASSSTARAGAFSTRAAGLVHETWESVRPHHPLRDARAHRLRHPRCQALRDRRLRARDPLGGAALSGGLDRRAGGAHRCAGGALQETVARYNAAATGDAARFDATRTDGLAAAADLSPPKSNWARPLDRPPYLAYPLIGAIAYTFGGVATDAASARCWASAGPSPASTPPAR